MKKLNLISLISLISMMCLSASAQDPVQKEPLDKQLKQVQSRVQELQKNLMEQSKSQWQFRNELEFKDPECAQLREEISHLEKQIIDKKKLLDIKLRQIPEVKEMETKRMALFQEMQDLKQQEQLILNEIVAEQNKPGVGEKSAVP